MRFTDQKVKNTGKISESPGLCMLFCDTIAKAPRQRHVGPAAAAQEAQELAQEGKKKKSAKLLYWLIQWTWGLAQNAIGLVVFALLGRGKTRRLGGAAVRSWNLKGSLSLGMFILMDRGHGDRVLVHEYGHTIQSLILGPLYLLVIGIPSLLWASLPALEKYRRKTGKTYYWLYCERWANYAGELSTGLASPEPSRARRRHPPVSSLKSQ